MKSHVIFHVYFIINIFSPSTFALKTSNINKVPGRKYNIMMSNVIAPTDSAMINTLNNVANLKVPSSAWRWPKVWPFPSDYMDLQENMIDNNTVNINENMINTFIVYLNFSTNQENLYIGSSQINLKNVAPFNARIIDIEELLSSLRKLDDDYFDNIALLIGVETFTTPIDVMKEIWRVLKPQGSCHILFSGKPQLPSGLFPIKMWTTMTDEQKIWIAGSYFHYSCFEGWENIEGYDLLGTTGNEKMKFDLQQSNLTDMNTAYSVQGKKVAIEDFTPNLNFNSTISILEKRLLGLRNIGSEDRKFLSYRLASMYTSSIGSEELRRKGMIRGLKAIEQIYETLKDVKEVVIPSPVKASLSSSMLSEWENNEEQILALRMSLGLDTPSPDFWYPVSAATKALSPKDKIHFLADLVPKFGNNQYSNRLQQFPLLLAEILSILRDRLPKLEEKTLQQFATDLLISDFLIGTDVSYQKIVKFVQSYPLSSLETLVTSPIQ